MHTHTHTPQASASSGTKAKRYVSLPALIEADVWGQVRRQSVRPYVYPSVCVSVHLFVCLSICVFVGLLVSCGQFLSIFIEQGERETINLDRRDVHIQPDMLEYVCVCECVCACLWESTCVCFQKEESERYIHKNICNSLKLSVYPYIHKNICNTLRLSVYPQILNQFRFVLRMCMCLYVCVCVCAWCMCCVRVCVLVCVCVCRIAPTALSFSSSPRVR